MIEIVKWSETFETCDTRKRQRLGWYMAPTGCDSKGYRKLMRMGKDGLEALGFFTALCQAMATLPMACRRSNTFKNGDGTMMEMDDILELSRLSGIDSADCRQIIGRLSACGWLRTHNPLNTQQFADSLPVSCREPADNLPQGEGEGEGEGEGQGEGEGEGQKRQTLSPAFDEFADDLTDAFPTSTAKLMQDTMNQINSLTASWTKRPHFTHPELELLQRNLAALQDLTDDDWKLLKAFMRVVMPEDWKPKPWQPASRSQFIGAVNDVATHADNWKRECRKRGYATGLEPQPQPMKATA